MDSAYFERALFSLGNRIDVSVRSRFFTGGTRRAIELRDRMCTHPTATSPPRTCQVDHIETYADGGLTTQDNGRLLCGFHNRLRNQREARASSASGPHRAPPEGAAPLCPGHAPQHPGSLNRPALRNPNTPGLWRARASGAPWNSSRCLPPRVCQPDQPEDRGPCG